MRAPQVALAGLLLAGAPACRGGASPPPAYGLTHVLHLPYPPGIDGAGLAWAKGGLWLAHDKSLYRFPVDEWGVPRTQAALAFPLRAQPDQRAHGLAFDGRDGLWVGYSGWPQLQRYAPVAIPKLVETLNLETRVAEYGLALHEGRLHVAGYSGRHTSFDPRAPAAGLESEPIDRPLFGLTSHAGRLWGVAAAALVTVERGRSVPVPLQGDARHFHELEDLAFDPGSGTLFIVTRETLLRFVPGGGPAQAAVASPTPKPEASRVAPPPTAGVLRELAAYDFPGEPVALARLAGASEVWLGASRTTPWGLMRLSLGPDGFALEQRLFERQPVSAVAAIGSQLVAVVASADGAPYEPPQLVLVDPAAGTTVRRAAAPERVNGLAADAVGGRIWACTRANTRQAADSVEYLTFDRALERVAKAPARQPGCQGLAWDGSALWAVDVFEEALYRLDPERDFAIVGAWALPVRYPAGLVADGRSLWVGDYSTRKIHRLAYPPR